jgi:uncharacterized protein YjcR
MNNKAQSGRIFFNSVGDVVDSATYKDQLYIKNKKGTLIAICGSHKANSKDLCCQPAGSRTNHLGTGRCSLHGGCSTGAPKGNQNARKHGIYSNIWIDQLIDDDKEYVTNHKIDSLQEIDSQIKLANVRIKSHLQDVRKWNGELVAFALQPNLMTKHDFARRTQIEEWIPLKEQEITRIQLSIDRMLLTKQRLEQDAGIDDQQAKENIREFIEKTTAISNPFENEQIEDDDNETQN